MTTPQANTATPAPAPAPAKESKKYKYPKDGEGGRKKTSERRKTKMKQVDVLPEVHRTLGELCVEFKAKHSKVFSLGSIVQHILQFYLQHTGNERAKTANGNPLTITHLGAQPEPPPKRQRTLETPTELSDTKPELKPLAQEKPITTLPLEPPLPSKITLTLDDPSALFQPARPSSQEGSVPHTAFELGPQTFAQPAPYILNAHALPTVQQTTENPSPTVWVVLRLTRATAGNLNRPHQILGVFGSKIEADLALQQYRSDSLYRSLGGEQDIELVVKAY